MDLISLNSRRANRSSIFTKTQVFSPKKAISLVFASKSFSKPIKLYKKNKNLFFNPLTFGTNKSLSSPLNTSATIKSPSTANHK